MTQGESFDTAISCSINGDPSTPDVKTKIEVNGQKRAHVHAHVAINTILDKPHSQPTHAAEAENPPRKNAPHIPEELWQIIFVLSLPLPPANVKDVKSDHLPGRCYAPLQVAQVCKSWRQVALATPQLWAGLNLIDQGTRRTKRAHRALIKLFLRRSGAEPFSFFMPSMRPQSDVYDPHYGRMMHLFGPHQRRLRRFGMMLPLDLAFLIMFRWEELQILQHFEIALSMTFTLGWNGQERNIANLTSLRSLTIAFAGEDAEIARDFDPGLARPGLTKLCLRRLWGSGIACSKVLQVLEGCPSLERCELDVGLDDLPDQTFLDVELMALTDLKINARASPARLFRHLKALDLKALELIGVAREHKVVLCIGGKDCFATFLRHSGSQLLSLRIVDVAIESRELTRGLSYLKNTAHIHLDGMVLVPQQPWP